MRSKAVSFFLSKYSHPFWEALTFAFLIQFGVYKGLLLARLVPLPKVAEWQLHEMHDR